MSEQVGDRHRRLIASLMARTKEAGLELDQGTAVLDESGWTCVVVQVADFEGVRWILRQARDPQVAFAFAAEREVLRLVTRRLDVEVPHWRLIDSGLVAYPAIVGSPAAREDPTTLEFSWDLNLEYLTGYAADVARQMVLLHRLPPPACVPVRTPGLARRQALTLLGSMHTRDLPQAWRSALEAWIRDDGSWLWTPRLLHADLHPGHTLMSGHRLLGIIDWTDAIVDDPAREFVYLAWADPKAGANLGLVASLLRTYVRESEPTDPTFVHRAAAYADLKVVELLVRGRSSGKDVLTGAALRRLGSGPRSTSDA